MFGPETPGPDHLAVASAPVPCCTVRMVTTFAQLRGLVLVGLALTTLPPTAARGWERTASEKGVQVYTRPGPGGNLPEFKGVTQMDASVWEVLAILDDIDRACEWTERCSASRELKKFSTTHRIFYNRTGAPWPFTDRDVVLDGRVSGLETGQDVVVDFRSIRTDLRPPVDGVVRMPVMDGTYRVRRLGPTRCEVTLRIRAHPGGVIPDWVAGWVTKRIPIDTLNGLRGQVTKTRGRYQAFIDRHDPSRRSAVAAPTPATPVDAPARSAR